MEPIILNLNNDTLNTTSIQSSNTVSQLKKLFFKTTNQNTICSSTTNTNLNPPNVDTLNSTITLKSRPTYVNRNISEIQNVRPQSPNQKLQQAQQQIKLNVNNNNILQQSQLDNNNTYTDEFESAFKIKENIQLSLRNLKPTLAGLDLLRSSASDDDDWPSPQPQPQPQSQPQVDVNNNNNSASDTKKQTQNKNLPTSYHHQHTHYQTTNLKLTQQNTSPGLTLVTSNNSSGTIKLQATNNLNKQNYVRAPSRSTYYMPNNANTSSTILTPICNSAMKKEKLNGNKRGKEEALSNSSSSDEEELHNQQQNQPLNNHQNKLQQLLLNSNTTQMNSISTLKLPIATNSMNFNNNLRQQNQQQSFNITPVASSSHITQQSNSIITTVTNIQKQQQQQQQQQEPSITPIDGNCVLTKICKTDHEYDSKHNSPNNNNLSLNTQSPALSSSSASSVASYSPIHSVTSPSTTNETIDLLDDSSSTASGPIYVRQPGFEHHAHEVTLEQANNNNSKITNLKSIETKITKIASDSNKIKNMTNLTNFNCTTNNNNKSSNKTKKKLCTITNTTCALPPTLNTENSNNDSNKIQNVQLKPLTKYSKKDFVPMRLRPLPPSFWQQPNQVNVSPGSMCLPPLFKNESDDEESNIDDNYKTSFEHATKNTKDVKMSPANTDLLFKLFDNIDQNDKRLQNIAKLTQQWKSRPSGKPIKGLSKALIKGEDPYILDAVAEGLFPLLRLESRNDTIQCFSYKNDINMNTSNSGINNNLLNSNNPNNLIMQNTLPSLQFEQNYTQALSEVVAAL